MTAAANIEGADTLLHRAEKEAAYILAMTAGRSHRLSHIRGSHGRRRAGEGDSFWQFRNYMPGDTAQQIDWRRSARSTGLYVRQQEWETAQNLYFWVDSSASMKFASHSRYPSKYERAQLLAMSLAVLFSQAGERIGLLSNTAHPPRSGRYGLRLMAQDLENASTTPQHGTSYLNHGSHVVFISDFLDEQEQLKRLFAPVQAQGCRAHLIQVIDPSEEDFPYKGRIRFEGMEGELPEVLERAEDLRIPYTRRFTAHQAALRDFATHQGWSFTTHRSDHGLTSCLLSTMLLIAEQDWRA
ncbi:MAG: DUF58 domain-containing protein [Sphingomonadales bacterium]|jgi:uncharacterized protein (DUF58 family)